jgi:tellurite resistance protein TehA-like permease
MDLKDLFSNPRKFVLKFAPAIWAVVFIYATIVIVGSEKTTMEKFETLAGAYLALGLLYAINWYYLKSTEEK